MTTGPSQCINVLSQCCYLFLLTVKEHSLTPHKGRSSLKQAPNLLQRCWRRLFSLFPLSTSSHGLNSCQSLPLLFLNVFLTVLPFHLGWCSSLLRFPTSGFSLLQLVFHTNISQHSLNKKFFSLSHGKLPSYQFHWLLTSPIIKFLFIFPLITEPAFSVIFRNLSVLSGHPRHLLHPSTCVLAWCPTRE